MKEQIERLRALLAASEEAEWIEHDGGGRPHSPSSYVEVETRFGVKQSLCSAFIPWPWDEEGSGNTDIIRWRFVKEPPSDKEIASYVPALLSALDEAVGVLGEASAWFERIRIPTEEAADYLNEGGWKDMCEFADRARNFLARYEGRE